MGEVWGHVGFAPSGGPFVVAACHTRKMWRLRSRHTGAYRRNQLYRNSCRLMAKSSCEFGPDALSRNLQAVRVPDRGRRRGTGRGRPSPGSPAVTALCSPRVPSGWGLLQPINGDCRVSGPLGLATIHLFGMPNCAAWCSGRAPWRTPRQLHCGYPTPGTLAGNLIDANVFQLSAEGHHLTPSSRHEPLSPGGNVADQ